MYTTRAVTHIVQSSKETRYNDGESVDWHIYYQASNLNIYQIIQVVTVLKLRRRGSVWWHVTGSTSPVRAETLLQMRRACVRALYVTRTVEFAVSHVELAVSSVLPSL